jgi:hypothetical protein
MKHLLVVLFSSVYILSACRQQTTTTTTPDLKIETDYASTPPHITRTDSFVFASRTYALPGPCAGEGQANCCTYQNNPDRVYCNNAVLTWFYEYNIEEAVKAAGWMVSQTGKGLERYNFKKEPITCYLFDKQVSGYAMSLDSKEMAMAYTIIVSGEVDGKAVVVQLETEKKPKDNSELQPVIRQILRLKP